MGQKKHAYVRLELRTVNGELSGSISLGNIEMNKDSSIRKAEAAPRTPSPIFDISRKGPVIAFSSKDGSEANHFEFELRGAEAELRFILSDELRQEIASEGLPMPKPFRLKRG